MDVAALSDQPTIVKHVNAAVTGRSRHFLKGWPRDDDESAIAHVEHPSALWKRLLAIGAPQIPFRLASAYGRASIHAAWRAAFGYAWDSYGLSGCMYRGEQHRQQHHSPQS